MQLSKKLALKPKRTDLFRNIKRLAAVGMLPVTPKAFTKNGIVWFLQSFGLFVESRQIPFYNRFYSREGAVILDCTEKEIELFYLLDL